jgi:uncharacterized heparinase superfamily protein
LKAIGKTGWYARRLAAMSPAELLHRCREVGRKRTGKYVTRRLWRPLACDIDLPILPGLRERLRDWAVPAVLVDEWRQLASDAERGTLFLLGQRWPARPLDERWQVDPVSGLNWPSRRYCHDIDFRHQTTLGDVKYVWELGRLQYLQPIAALAFKTDDVHLAQLCANHIESWIDANPFATGVAWASGIELAVRVVSMVVVSTLVGQHFTAQQRAKVWATLEAHGIWLQRFPSLYSSANNHRIAEGLGLLTLGALCPSLRQAAAWRDAGWSVLCDASIQQILADGVGAEQSIGYTGVVVEMLLLGLVIAKATEQAVPDSYVRQIGAAGEWLRWCTDQAGNLPRIGDDDNAQIIGAYRLDDSHTNSVLSCAAAMLRKPALTPPNWQPHLRHAVFGFPLVAGHAPTGLRIFNTGGYSIARYRMMERAVLLTFDHGPLGYLGIAAHGHADALAVCLHMDGQPVFVDAGTFLYHSGGGWRRHFRSTAAHNTLRLQQADASIQAGNFNWGHKARARLIAARADADGVAAEAEHDGYVRRFGALHRRQFVLSTAENEVAITDWLDASRPLQVEISFLLSPGVKASVNAETIIVVGQDDVPLLEMTGAGPLIAEIVGSQVPGGWYSPTFNVKQPTTRLCWRGTLNPGERQRTCLRVVPLRASQRYETQVSLAAPLLEPVLGTA